MKQSYFIYRYKKVLLIIFAIIINGQLKQPSKMNLHIWKWSIITAMSSRVELHLILGIIICFLYFLKILILKNTGSISIQVSFWNKKYQYKYLKIKICTKYNYQYWYLVSILVLDKVYDNCFLILPGESWGVPLNLVSAENWSCIDWCGMCGWKWVLADCWWLNWLPAEPEVAGWKLQLTGFE